jgi:hypothetical protein
MKSLHMYPKERLLDVEEWKDDVTPQSTALFVAAGMAIVVVIYDVLELSRGWQVDGNEREIISNFHSFGKGLLRVINLIWVSRRNSSVRCDPFRPCWSSIQL